MSNRKKIGILLVIAGLMVATYTAVNAMYVAPGGKEVPLSELEAKGIVAAEPTDTIPTSLPSRLIIPKLGIDAHVQHLGVTKDGLMAAPKNFTDVSWYKYGAVPGQVGSAVLSGHEDNAVNLDGVFKYLYKLAPGDEIIIVRQDGTRLTFVVDSERIYPYDLSGAELERIFTETGDEYLRLITCTGDWLPEAKTNDKRLVVFATLK